MKQNQKIKPSALATAIDELDSSVKIMEKRPLSEHVSVNEIEPPFATSWRRPEKASIPG